MNAGIAGAGILGRLLALRLLEKGWKVTLFDSDSRDGLSSCSYVAAGMLSPLSEIETAETKIFELGLRSMDLWDKTLAQLRPVYTRRTGSLLISHPQDMDELSRIKERFESKLHDSSLFQWRSALELAELEPGLGHWPRQGLFIPLEGQLDNRELLSALGETLTAQGAVWKEHVGVQSLEPGKIRLDNEDHAFDTVFDCRGMGAKADLPGLRGVRGELVYLHAPEVNLTRPIRLIHPRYRIYIVPRPGNVYVIGASQIESEDLSPISVRTLLELLSAAYSVHPEFAEARVLGTHVHCRPAFSDNLPRVYYGEGRVRVNGLYRHGFLVAPSLVEDVMRYLENGLEGLNNPELFLKETP